jgi:hypothetical protein
MRQSLQINTLWETEIMCERGYDNACEAEALHEAKVAVEAVLVHYTHIYLYSVEKIWKTKTAVNATAKNLRDAEIVEQEEVCERIRVWDIPKLTEKKVWGLRKG